MKLGKTIALGLTAAVLIAGQLPAHAATVTYTLQRTSALTNVNDASGRWQFDGGRVLLNGINGLEVGRYVQKKRFAFGPPALNKAATETTIIWKWGHSAFTIQGSHFVSNGQQVGGVSATSSGFSAYTNGTYVRNGANVTITY